METRPPAIPPRWVILAALAWLVLALLGVLALAELARSEVGPPPPPVTARAPAAIL